MANPAGRTRALTLDLKNDAEAIAQYDAYHANPFAEVVAALKTVGITDLRIYRLGTRLFMTYQADEGFNDQQDFARYLAMHPRCQQWEDLMGTFQQALPGTPEGEKWQPMQEVFNLAAH